MGKGWTVQQLRGITGSGISAIASLVVAGELPVNWVIPMGTGQVVGLAITVISVFCYYSASHQDLRYKCGNGTICLNANHRGYQMLLTVICAVFVCPATATTPTG